MDDADKLAKMKPAAQDPLLLADLREAMSAFAEADAEWWESQNRKEAADAPQ